jgi:hypothetical protein
MQVFLWKKVHEHASINIGRVRTRFWLTLLHELHAFLNAIAFFVGIVLRNWYLFANCIGWTSMFAVRRLFCLNIPRMGGPGGNFCM